MTSVASLANEVDVACRAGVWVWFAGELSDRATLSEEASLGTRAPRVRESARCKDALDFTLDLDVEVLSIVTGGRGAAGLDLGFAFFLSALAIT
jgi:hypothetical protein